MSLWTVSCNHCGERADSSADNLAFPCCSACIKAGHVRSTYGCPACRTMLEEDLRAEAQYSHLASDALESAMANARLDINFFDND